jgi:riboflavin biosynthesis pyrimidine reductase
MVRLGSARNARPDHRDTGGHPRRAWRRALPRRHPLLHPDEVEQDLSGLLELLFEEPGLAAEQLPPPLAELYDGEFGFGKPLLYANFVTSLDGVTAVDPGASGQGSLISDGLPADRFLMGLLRGFADVVLIGAGTLRAESGHVWSAGRVYPPCADAFVRLREFLLLPPAAPLAVVSGSGSVDPALPALAGGMILTTAAGAARLAGRAPEGVKVIALGAGEAVAVGDAVAALRAEGYRSILTEGGPHLFGQLLNEGLVEQLFLTLSPALAGRERTSTQIGLIEGTSLLPGIDLRGRLLSVRRSGSHLFLRYDLAQRPASELDTGH